ncbi:MAG: Ger(x)C family spore germination protein [Defluviitaleaceae bacterium]|nr:Ger(x)C family spore germination protein [Defluviitaleaceae bacterium]
MKGTKFGFKFAIIGILLFAMLSFNWDRTELEGRAFVVAIGIDAADDNGNGDRFEVHMSIADVAAMEGKGGAEDAAILRSISGNSLARAMGLIDAKMSETAYYGHTKAIVLGGGILEDEALLREVADTLARKEDINIKCIITAADGAAKDILKAKPREQSLLGVYLSGFYNNDGANAAAAVVKLDLEGLTESLRDTHSAVIPKVSVKKDGESEGVAISGVAVLKNYKLEDCIEDEVMAGYLWLMEDAAGTQIAVKYNDEYTTLFVQNSKPKLNIYEHNGKLGCYVRLRAEGSIEGGNGNANNLQQDFANEIYREIEETIRIFRDELGVDGFGLKERLRKTNWGLYQKYGNDWQRAFEGMEFTVDIDVVIRNF